MLHHDDGQMGQGGLDLQKVVHQLQGFHAVHAGGGLVQEDNLGVRGDGTADFQAAAVRIGQILGQLIGLAGEQGAENLHDFHGSVNGPLLLLPFGLVGNGSGGQSTAAVEVAGDGADAPCRQ